MSEPTNFRAPPDRDFNTTYAAVGKALSAWERLEIHLSHLYSIFVGKPRQIEALMEYGREGRIFKERMRLLSGAAESHFARNCDQALEGAFDGVVDNAITLSLNRHQIAHGYVAKIPGVGKDKDGEDEAVDYYVLVPPWYAFRTLSRGADHLYFYGSETLLLLSQAFLACAANARDLGITLDPPAKEIAELVSQYDEMDKHQYLFHHQ